MIQLILFAPVIAAGALWELTCRYFEAGREFVRSLS